MPSFVFLDHRFLWLSCTWILGSTPVAAWTLPQETSASIPEASASGLTMSWFFDLCFYILSLLMICHYCPIFIVPYFSLWILFLLSIWFNVDPTNFPSARSRSACSSSYISVAKEATDSVVQRTCSCVKTVSFSTISGLCCFFFIFFPTTNGVWKSGTIK